MALRLFARVPSLGWGWMENVQPVPALRLIEENDDRVLADLIKRFAGDVSDFFANQFWPWFTTLRHDDTLEPFVEPVNWVADVAYITFGTLSVVALFKTTLLAKWVRYPRKLLTIVLGQDPLPQVEYRQLRRAFNNTPFLSPSEAKNHTHGLSAGIRASARRFMQSVASATGLEYYSYQMSSTEQNNNVRGTRTYYWSRDVSAAPQFDDVTGSDLVSLIDVDYYLDMPSHLAEYDKPHVLFTIQPEEAAATRADYSYTFNEFGELEFSVRGGARYVHKLWHYGTDWFTVSQKYFGIPYKTVVYDVQTKRVGQDRQVILLSPMRVHTGLSAILSSWMGRELRRLDPVRGGFAKIVVKTNNGQTTSVARLKSEVSCTVPSVTFDALLSSRNNSPQGKVNNYMIKSLIAKTFGDESALVGEKDLISPILTDYLNNAPDHPILPLTAFDIPTMSKFSFAVPDASDKPALVSFALPFGVPPAFVPMNNKATSDQSIIGRVLIPREKAKDLLGGFRDTPTKQDAFNEFIKRMVPVPHTAVPVDYNEIEERQIKPGQKKDLREAGMLGHVKRIAETFMKKEAYEEPKDTRNITTFNPKSKIEYAQFMYAIMDYLKTMSFYAFGRSPKEVAERVARICSRSNRVVCPDIHRMDGYVNEFCRRLEAAFGSRFFMLEYVQAFLAAHEQSYGNTGVTSFGMRYEQECSRGSGEMGTSAWNTIINLFIFFYAMYLKTMSFDAAWSYLIEFVIAGGDDGLGGDIDDVLLVRAARDVGFILKCPSFCRGEVGVNFLARIYGPGVWEGNPNSMCSLRRQMEKFHLSVAVPLDPHQKLFEKAVSFALTDSMTPVIGPLCQRILDISPGMVSTGLLKRYGDDIPIENQYPNALEDWMQEVAKMQLPLTDIPSLLEWLAVPRTLEELLHCPSFYEEGREFTFDDWDPDSGMLIKKTVDIITGKKKEKPPQVRNIKIGFGDVSVSIDTPPQVVVPIDA